MLQSQEFARELQRREYVRLQKLKRERQLRRAQTVPAESTAGGSTGELQVRRTGCIEQVLTFCK